MALPELQEITHADRARHIITEAIKALMLLDMELAETMPKTTRKRKPAGWFDPKTGEYLDYKPASKRKTKARTQPSAA